MILTKEQVEGELKAAMQQAGKLALEEAAKIAEHCPKCDDCTTADDIAFRIRALAESLK